MNNDDKKNDLNVCSAATITNSRITNKASSATTASAEIAIKSSLTSKSTAAPKQQQQQVASGIPITANQTGPSKVKQTVKANHGSNIANNNSCTSKNNNNNVKLASTKAALTGALIANEPFKYNNKKYSNDITAELSNSDLININRTVKLKWKAGNPPPAHSSGKLATAPAVAISGLNSAASTANYKMSKTSATKNANSEAAVAAVPPPSTTAAASVSATVPLSSAAATTPTIPNVAVASTNTASSNNNTVTASNLPASAGSTTSMSTAKLKLSAASAAATNVNAAKKSSVSAAVAAASAVAVQRQAAPPASNHLHPASIGGATGTVPALASSKSIGGGGTSKSKDAHQKFAASLPLLMSAAAAAADGSGGTGLLPPGTPAEQQQAVASAAAALKQRLKNVAIGNRSASSSSSTSSNTSLPPTAGFVNALSNALQNIISDNSDTDTELYPQPATTDLSESEEDSVSEILLAFLCLRPDLLDDIPESDPDSCAHEAECQEDEVETEEESEESDESEGDEEDEDEDADILLQDNDADEEDIDDEDEDDVQEVGGNFLLDASNDRSRNLTALFEAAANDKAPVLRHATHAIDETKQALTKMRCANSPRDKTIFSRSLVAACTDNDVNTVRRLLCKGNVNLSEATDDGESLLSMACSAGYYELAQVLLAMSAAQVEDKGQKDSTPLMEAASAGHLDIVQLLLNHNADVNAHCATGNTPLMFACAGGHVEIVKELLKSGANVEEQNENGHTPLMEAASAGHVEVAKVLLEHGAGINTHSNEFKESALTLACYKGHLDMVRFLLQAGADQEHKTDEMHTALMEASMDGHVEVARLLLDSGAQVNMPTDSFESPLTLAACGGHVELATLLIERGANIEEVNDEGYTPLMEAAREGHEEMVALLLSKGANINATTEETQETALTLACCGGFSEVAEFLIKEGANLELGASTPLMEAAQEGHTDLVRFLLQSKSNVHAETQTGDTALTHACENGHTDAAEVLLGYGAELEHESEGGRTPLMKACRAGHLCTVKFLIQKGANVNKQTTSNDHTPLSLACAGGHQAVVELLLKSGADPFHKLKDNSTMLIEAAKGGHTRVVELLFKYPHIMQNELAAVNGNATVVPAAAAAASQMRIINTQHQKMLQQQLQQQLQQLSAPPGLHEVSEAARASNQQLFHQQQFSGNGTSVVTGTGEYIDAGELQLSAGTAASTGSEASTEEYAAIDINSLSAQQQEALIAKSRLFHLQAGFDQGIAQLTQQQLQQQQATLPPPMVPLAPCKHVGTGLDMGHINSLTPPQKTPPAPPVLQGIDQQQQQQQLIKLKGSGARKNRQAPSPFALNLQTAEAIDAQPQQQQLEEVRSQPVGDDGSGMIKLQSQQKQFAFLSEEPRYIRRRGFFQDLKKVPNDNKTAQDDSMTVTYVDRVNADSAEDLMQNKGATVPNSNEILPVMNPDNGQPRIVGGGTAITHSSEVLPSTAISDRPKVKATNKNNRKQAASAQTAALQQNQMVSIINNLPLFPNEATTNQQLDQHITNHMVFAAQQRQLQLQQEQQKLAAASLEATNTAVAISNSPASPLASPSSGAPITYAEHLVVVDDRDAKQPLQQQQNGATPATAAAILQAHKINAVIGSQELHEALEAACCQAASSLMQEAPGSTDSINSLGINGTGCTASASQLKILHDGWHLLGMRRLLCDQPKSPTETPPEIEEITMMPPESVGEEGETRAEMKNLATLCSAAAVAAAVAAATKEIDISEIINSDAETEAEENTLPPEPIEITEDIGDEDATNSGADNEEGDDGDDGNEMEEEDDLEEAENIDDENENDVEDENASNDSQVEESVMKGVKFADSNKLMASGTIGRNLSARLENLILSNVPLKPEMLSQALCDFRQDLNHADLVQVIPQIGNLKTATGSAALSSVLQQQLAVAAAAAQTKVNKQDSDLHDEVMSASGATGEMYPVLEHYTNEDNCSREPTYDIAVEMEEIFQVIHNVNDPSLQEFASNLNCAELADFGINPMCKNRWNGNWGEGPSKWTSQDSFISATHQQALLSAEDQQRERQANLLLLDYQLQQQELQQRFAEAELKVCEELQHQHQQTTLSLIPFSSEDAAAAVAAHQQQQQQLQQTLPNATEFHLQQQQQEQKLQQLALESDQEFKHQLQQLQQLQQQQQSNARLIKAVAAAAGQQQHQQQHQQQAATNFVFNVEGNDKSAQSLQLLFQLPTTVQQQQQQHHHDQEAATQLQQLQMHHQELQDQQKQQQQQSFKLLQQKHQTLQDLQADTLLHQQQQQQHQLQQQADLDPAAQNKLLMQQQAALAQQVLSHQAMKQKLQEQLMLEQQQTQQLQQQHQQLQQFQQACVQHTQQVQVATQTQPSVVVPHPNVAISMSPSPSTTPRATAQYYNAHYNTEHSTQVPMWPMASSTTSSKAPGGISKKAIDKQSRKDRRFSMLRQTPAGSQANTTVQQQQQQQQQQQPQNPQDAAAAPQDKTIEVDSETDSNHDTALTLACAGGHEELVELLISRGANIEHRDKKGFTPLILAATAGHEKVVDILLKNQAELEAQSERTKDTPLSLACSGGRYEVVELLLSVGANKEHRNVSDYTPLSLAASGGYVNIIKLLLSHGAEINSRTGSKLGISPLMLAAMNGHTAAVKLLLDQGSDINAQIETNRNTALTLACFQGRHEVVSLLLDRKANVEHRAKTGLTPLMEAASGGYIDVGRVLLDKGADVNAAPVPTSRDTALTIAADKGHQKFVELLLSRGASVEVKNKKGNSPLWLAAHGGHLSVVELLYDHNADIDSQDNRRVSCLMAAFRKGHTKIVKWMVQYVTQFPSDQEMNRFISTISDKELSEKCYDCMKIIRSAKEAQAVKANKNASILLEELDLERTREESRKAAAARRRERKKKKKMEKKEEKRRQMEGVNGGDDQHDQDDADDKDSDKDDDTEKEDDDEDVPNPREEGDSGIDQGSCSSSDMKSANADQPQTDKSNASNKNKNKKQKKVQQPIAQLVEEPKKLQQPAPKKEETKTVAKKQTTLVAEVAKPNTPNANKRVETKKEELPVPVTIKKKETSINKREKENMAPKEAIAVAPRQQPTQQQPAKDKLTSSSESSTNISTGGNRKTTTGRNDDIKKTDESKTNTATKRVEIDGWKEVVRKSSTQQVTSNSSQTSIPSSTTHASASSNVAAQTNCPVLAATTAPPAVVTTAPEMTCKKVQVPVNAISRVIGRAGSNINAIRATTGAHIEVEKQGKNQSERSITIKGLTDATKQAHMLILALIKDPDVDILQMLPRINTSIKATPLSSASTTTASSSPPMTVGTWDNKTATAALQSQASGGVATHFSSAASTASTSSTSSASSTPANVKQTGKSVIGKQQTISAMQSNKSVSGSARAQTPKTYYSQTLRGSGSSNSNSSSVQKSKGQEGNRSSTNSGISQKGSSQSKTTTNYGSSASGGQTFAAKLTGTQASSVGVASPKKSDSGLTRSGVVAPYGRGKPVASTTAPMSQLGGNSSVNTLAGPIGTFNIAEVEAVNAAAAAAAASSANNNNNNVNTRPRAVTPIAPPLKTTTTSPTQGVTTQIQSMVQQQAAQSSQQPAAGSLPSMHVSLPATNQNLVINTNLLNDINPVTSASSGTSNTSFSTQLAAKIASEYSLFNDYQSQWGNSTAVGDNLQFQNPVNIGSLVGDVLPQADASKAPGYNRNILSSPVGSSKASSNHSSSPPSGNVAMMNSHGGNNVQQALNIITANNSAAPGVGSGSSTAAARSPMSTVIGDGASVSNHANGTSVPSNVDVTAAAAAAGHSPGVIKPPTAPIQRPVGSQLHTQPNVDAQPGSALSFGAIGTNAGNPNAAGRTNATGNAAIADQQQQNLQRFYEQLNAAQQVNYPIEQAYGGSSSAAAISRLNPRASAFSQGSGGGGANAPNKCQQQQQQQQQQPPPAMVQQQQSNIFQTNQAAGYNATKPLSNTGNAAGGIVRPQSQPQQSTSAAPPHRWYGGALDYPTYTGRSDVLQLENGGLVGSPAAMSPNQDDIRKMPRPIGTERASWKYNNFSNVAAAALNMDDSLSTMQAWPMDPKATAAAGVPQPPQQAQQQPPNWMKQQYRFYNNTVAAVTGVGPYPHQHEQLNVPMDYHGMQPPNLNPSQHINLLPPYAYPHFVGPTAADMAAAHMPEKVELWDHHDKHPWTTNWTN